jgi:hypothetical protein
MRWATLPLSGQLSPSTVLEPWLTEVSPRSVTFIGNGFTTEFEQTRLFQQSVCEGERRDKYR